MLQLKQGDSPDEVIQDGGWSGWSLLAKAVWEQNTQEVFSLLQGGANPDITFPQDAGQLGKHWSGWGSWANWSLLAREIWLLTVNPLL